jgi:hypothetical protein
MRAVFSIVGLLVVLVVVLMLGRKQLAALGFGGAAAPAASSAPGVSEQAQTIQQRTQSNVQRALEAGMQQRASEPAQ